MPTAIFKTQWRICHPTSSTRGYSIVETVKHEHNNPNLVEDSSVTQLDDAQQYAVTILSVATQMRSRFPQLTDKIPLEEMLADVNTFLCTIPTTNITEKLSSYMLFQQ